MIRHQLTRTVGLALALAAVAVVPGYSAGQKDQLEGKWTIVSMTDSREKLGPDDVGFIVLEFKGDKVTLLALDKAKEGSFKADNAKNPRQFEMELDLVTQGRRVLGIYKIEKDLLTLCWTNVPDTLPAKFEVKKVDEFRGSPNKLVILKRGEPNLTPAQREAMRAKVEDKARRKTSANNLRHIAIAMHNFHDTYKRFPPPAIMSKDGKPLLSWRVAILPFIEELALYNQFKLNEPWDSAHNIKLLEKMPKFFLPQGVKTKEPHTTYYQLFVGPDAWPITPQKGTLFNAAGLRMPASFLAGTSNNIMVVEAGEAVPWTKPADLPFDAKKPLPKLGGLFKDGFHVVMGDASIRFVGRGIPERILRLVINRNTVEPIPNDWHERR